MKLISFKQETKRAAVVVPLAAKLGQLYTSRIALISKMSGYPSAIHSIGRLQRSIKLDDFSSLLESLKRVSSIAYITAEVIESMDGTKVDKYQMDRTEIATYVANITSTITTFDANETEIDLISHLITSFEANPSAWMLQGGDNSSDIHLKFQNLYKEIIDSGSDLDLAVYAPHSNSVSTFAELPQIKEIAKTLKKSRAKKDKGTVETDGLTESRDIQNLYTIYKLSCIRVIDHVYQLMMDKDAWYSFVAPRTKADVANNLERAKTLRVFALYCHNLLTYNQFFALEMFLKSYDLVQKWIMHFPPLDAVTTADLEGILRKYDLLNARHDVQTLIDSFGESASHDIHALAFPAEFISDFGLSTVLKEITEDVGKYSLSGTLTDLATLDAPQYLPLISGVAASALDITYKLSSIILIDKIVSKEVRESLSVLLPAMTGSTSENTMDRFKTLNVRATIPFVIPHAASWHVMSGVETGIKNDVLHLDSAAPQYTTSYHEFVRSDLKFRMTTDKLISQTYPHFFPQQFIDHDRAHQLRETMALQWKTLIPDFMGSGDTIYTFESLSATGYAVRQLIESISGINYEIAIKELTLPHLRVIWATYLSSFALLYYNQSQASLPLKESPAGIIISEDQGEFDLVIGHGNPYGTDYNGLEGIQGKLTKDTKLISIGNGLYLRLLTAIPVVFDDLRKNENFYSQKPTMYFASNSVTVAVKKWVFSEGLVNFSLFPNMTSTSVPAVKFSPKYAFITQNLFVSTDLYYRPSAPEVARETYPLHIVTNDWRDDKRQVFLEYKNFGPYLQPAGAIPAIDDVELIATAVKKVEQAITADDKELAETSSTAGSAAASSAKAVADSLADSQKKNNALGDAEAKESL